MAGKRNRHPYRSATPAQARDAQRPATRAGLRMHMARGWFRPSRTCGLSARSRADKPTPEHHLGWMVNHVQVGDRVAVIDHEVGRSAAVEPGQPEELARGPAWPRTPARAQNALSVLGRPSARCLRLPIRTAGRRALIWPDLSRRQRSHRQGFHGRMVRVARIFIQATLCRERSHMPQGGRGCRLVVRCSSAGVPSRRRVAAGCKIHCRRDRRRCASASPPR